MTASKAIARATARMALRAARTATASRSASTEREVRFGFAPECRAVADPGKPLQIVGHAVVFNALTKLPGFRESVLPGAFRSAIEGRQNVACLWNHDQNHILGRVEPGTLRIAEDSIGLRYVCDLPDTPEARVFHIAIKRGDVSGSSYAFKLAAGDVDWSDDYDSEERTYFARRSIKNVTNLL